MRTIFIFLAIFYTHFATAQIVNIPDPNFKNALLNHNPAIDTNNDDEIQVAEAQAVDSLFLVYESISDLTGIEAFINLQILYCTENYLTSLDVSNLPNLQSLYCNYNQLSSLEVSNLPNLQSLYCDNNQLSSLEVSNLPNLQSLDCNYNQLSSLEVSNLPNLKSLYCGDNQQLSSLEVSNLPNLQELYCRWSQLTSLDVSSLTNLQSLDCFANQLSSLEVSNLPNLQSLDCGSNQLSSLEVSNLPNLKYLYCGDNQLSSLEVSNLPNLQTLYCTYSQLSSLEVSNLPNLQSLTCNYNQLSSLEVSNLPNLQSLNCGDNQLSSLEVSNLPNLQSLTCNYNQLSSLEVSNLPNLQSLTCNYSQLSSLEVSNLPNLKYLYCGDNQLSSLEVSNLPNLQSLNCNYNQLSSLEVSNLPKLKSLNCSYSQLSSLDVSDLPNLKSLACGENQLSSLLIKNGSNEDLYFDYNPNLVYICCDESQLQSVKNAAIEYGLSNCQVNTYCFFNPGGNYNTISGNIIFDNENNGCDENDAPLNYQIIQIEDDAEGGYTVSDNLGKYELYCNAGTYTLQPFLENPYFSVNAATFNFTEDDNISVTQNFCIAPNGTHHDLEITLLPLNPARPGFDANYQITYKNKGTQTENGSIHLQFDDSVLDFVSASPALAAQSDSLLTWSFADLQPFESRSINVVLNLNSPQETPPLNGGDIVSFLAYINYPQTDETPEDNSSALRQTVVNSFDPNDKTCLQGSQIDVKNIDDYLHYVIRFQNTGSAEAIQVVVKDELADNLDISTFQMVAASHDYRLRLENRTLEVFFENINLPDSTTNEPESHGFVAFKIKAADSVTIGSHLKNTAEIYFDYNFPIITNTTETAVIELSPLSVDWLYFRGKCTTAANVLEWATAAEYASDFFEVQRSADGRSWSVIGKVAAAGKAHSYTFSDAQPLSGLNYYRLRQQNRDGTDDFSQMLVIGGDAADTHIFISPNPASDFITLNSSETIESVEIYDAAGRLRLAQKGIGNQIDVRNLASGSYFVKAQIQGRNYINHFTKH